jgi:hypothetical protein
MKRKKRLPHLRTEQEIHDFWSTHSVADYIHDMELVDEKIEFAPELARRIRERSKKTTVMLPLELWTLRQAKEIAAKRHTHYHHLWQGLRSESAGRP